MNLYYTTTMTDSQARHVNVGDLFTLKENAVFSDTTEAPAGEGVPVTFEVDFEDADAAGFILPAGTAIKIRATHLKMRESENAVEKLRLWVELPEGGPGSGNFGHAGRPGEVGGSMPGNGGTGSSSKSLPAAKWEDPPAPGGGRDPMVKGGVTAIGLTNTQLGDMGEMLLVKRLGMKSLIPKGQRQNPLDLKWDDSQYAYELKAVTTNAKEYKIKMKAKEVASKLRYAKEHGYIPGMMMLVIDRESGVARAYRKEGIGNFRLTDETSWTFMGRVTVGKKDWEYRKPKKESADECDVENQRQGH